MQNLRQSLNSMKENIQSFGESKPSFSLGKASNSMKQSLSAKSLKSVVNTPVNSIIGVSKSMKPETPSTVSSFLNLKSVSFWVLVIILLAFLGFNIFTYLGKGTDLVTGILAPITSALGMLTGETAKTTVSNASTGSQKIVDTTSETAQNVIDYSAKGTNTGISFLQGNLKKNAPIVVDPENQNSLSEANVESDEPEPVRSTSQQHGYCYIGKINDTRYCAKVSAKNQCMSGDIYPTMDVCVNPNLRA